MNIRQLCYPYNESPYDWKDYTDIGSFPGWAYHQTFNIRSTLVGYRIVAHADVVGASPVGAAPTTFSLST